MVLTMLTGCYTYSGNHHKHKPHHKQKMHKAPKHRKHYGDNHGIHQGEVSNIEMFIVKADSSGASAILGAVAGGVVGHQMGSGSGRDLATGAGAIGGAVVGNEIEQRNEGDREIYRITVNIDNGDTLQFEYEEIEDLQIGDRVKIENGHIDLI